MGKQQKNRNDREKRTPTSELLAPAGSLEAFFAALENGADAIYCGLTEFSARARAKNFTLAEVERMTAYAHQQGRRLYVTLNTLLKEKELPRLIDLLAALEGMAGDGIIIQDLGVWRLARRHFPDLPLHASTQMTVHNGAGVKMLERMGFSRAVLARELSLAEIARIRQQSNLELEHFVHGALCFSVSGQCFFSSALSGASGNRGRCAQPCRRRYYLGEQPGYHFSTSDLSALELLPELSAAGVMSFKIEGRMKSADYVARVVAAYRRALDAPANARKEALGQAAEQLELSFGREPTKGFLTGFVPTGLGDAERKGALGRHLGEVTTLRGGLVGFASADRLHVGDRIRIQPQNDQAGSGFTVREIVVGSKKVKAARAGDFVQIPIPPRAGFFKPGDSVFKVGGKISFLLSPEACRQKLAAVSPAEPVAAQEEELARRRALALTELNEISKQEKIAPNPAPLTFAVRGRGLADLDLLDNPQVSSLELPLTSENLSALSRAEGRLGKNRERLGWEIPPLLFSEEWEEYRRAVRILAGRGYRTFRLGNLGHLPLFAGLDGLQLLGGFRCYTMNQQAALAWQELGLARLTLNLEDEQENMAALWRLGLPLTTTVYSPLPILISRIPLKGVRSGSVLRSDKGEGYRILAGHGLTEVQGEEDFSLAGSLGLIRSRGAGELLADLSHCGANSPKGRQILGALAVDQPLPATTSFNFFRGLK
ncbi:U32 family peptidase [Desulfurivibrio sp. D14AmB]|uniref:U32 family peptidase n=1 Tax=Desulfurivibrio sp. D14AmB TaxID=3374370 RepID=UPI00376F22E7